MSIKNEITMTYEVDGETYTTSASCEIEKTTTVPTVEIKKSGYPDPAKKGDIITYRVDITVGDGDDFEDVQKFVDVSDGKAEFITGTLKLDGELMENQDLSVIEVDFEPNTYHYLEYQMLCL